jgi:hypothetical protein
MPSFGDAEMLAKWSGNTFNRRDLLTPRGAGWNYLDRGIAANGLAASSSRVRSHRQLTAAQSEALD